MEWLNASPLLIPIAIFFVAFFESFALLGVLVPGVVLLFSLAALANAQDIVLWAVLIFGAAGACLGDISSYMIGLKLSHRVETLPWFKKHQSWLDQGHWFIDRWGWLSVIIGRFLGPLRPVIPLVAGTLGMKPRLFIPLNIVTALAWAPAYLLPGFFTGELADLWKIQPLSTRSIIIYLLSAISISAGALAIYHHTHPHRWHLRGWITRGQAERWPVGPAALAMISLIWGATLLLWPPAEQNLQFQQWAELWRESRLAAAWAIGVRSSAPEFMVLMLMNLLLWLILKKRSALAALTLFTTLMVVILSNVWLTAHLSDFATRQFTGLTLFILFTGLFANLISSRVQSLRRWPIYLLTSLVMIFGLFSHLWVGDLMLSEALLATIAGLIGNAFLRGVWQWFRLPLSVPMPNGLIILYALTLIAWCSLPT